MKVLITGSEGFTGAYICQEFAAAGWEVWHAGPSPKPGHPFYLNIDLLKPSSLASINELVQPQVVIHLAAVAYVAESDPKKFYQVNFLGTCHLLDTLSRSNHPPQCTILASSANVYGNSDAGTLNEDAPLNPANDYAFSKLAMEYAAKTYMDKIGIVITRPFNYTGVGQNERFLVAKIASHYRCRKSYLELGNLDIARDFSDVRDVARIYRLLAERMPVNEVVNICSGVSVSLKQILQTAQYITAHHVDIHVNPELVRENEVKKLQGDRTKLEKLIEIGRPRLFEQTLEWMLKP